MHILTGSCDFLAHTKQTWEYWNPSSPFFFLSEMNLLRCWLPFIYFQTAGSWYPFQLCFFAFHNRKTIKPSLFGIVALYLLVHIRWELCLLRLFLKLIAYTHVPQNNPGLRHRLLGRGGTKLKMEENKMSTRGQWFI